MQNRKVNSFDFMIKNKNIYRKEEKQKKFTDKTLKRQKVFTNIMNCGKI